MRLLAFALLVVATVTASFSKRESDESDLLLRSVSIAKIRHECNSNELFDEYCNSCICSPNGQYKFCTQRRCPAPCFPNEEMSDQEYVRMCAPGTLFLDECSKCHCSDDGMMASCIFGLCLPAISTNSSLTTVKDSSKMCEPGKNYESECIKCSCALDGHTVDCKPKSCIPASVVPFRNVIRDDALLCQPRKSYHTQCSDCKCSEDGTNASCSLKYCPAETQLRKKKDIDRPFNPYREFVGVPEYTESGFPFAAIILARENIPVDKPIEVHRYWPRRIFNTCWFESFQD